MDSPRSRLRLGGAITVALAILAALAVLLYLPTYRDDSTFRSAQHKDTSSARQAELAMRAYQQYVARYPTGRHVQDALAALVHGLADIRPPAPNAPMGDTSHRAGSTAAGNALCQIGSPAVSALIQGLRDPNKVVRMFCAEVCGAMGEAAKSATPHLIEALKHDPNPAVRESCAWAIAGVGGKDPNVVGALKQASETDPEAFVRAMASRHLKSALAKPGQDRRWPRHLSLVEFAALSDADQTAWVNARVADVGQGR